MEKYINLFTDFGFKKIFGTEVNKDLLIDFLNVLLRDREKIKTLTYLKNEHLGNTQEDRKAVFDLYCENESGEKFIIELQKVEQDFFKDRSIYYSTFALQEQAIRGRTWQYELKGVYTIGILDFNFDSNPHKFQSYIKLLDIDTLTVFYEKLTFVYLEMPKFTKTEDELDTHFDKWLYIIRNLHQLDKIPAKIKEKIFTRLFEQAEIAKYNEKDRYAYQESKKHYLDLKNALDTSYKKGEEKGIEKGKREEKFEIALQMLKDGESVEKIMRYTSLSKEEIEKL
jgi:predicted transposase/invertase (TIGR01784 family)